MLPHVKPLWAVSEGIRRACSIQQGTDSRGSPQHRSPSCPEDTGSVSIGCCLAAGSEALETAWPRAAQWDATNHRPLLVDSPPPPHFRVMCGGLRTVHVSIASVIRVERGTQLRRGRRRRSGLVRGEILRRSCYIDHPCGYF